MRPTCQRYDAIDVLQAEGRSKLLRRHAAFKAVPDAPVPQVGGGENGGKPKDGASASDLGVEGGKFQGTASAGPEHKPFGRSDNGVKVTVHDRLHPARKNDAGSARLRW